MQRKVLCTILSTCTIFFYSFAMEKEQPQTSNKQIVSLIAIIKTQQNILGYTPPTDILCIPEYFESAFERIAKTDPKDERAKIYEKLIKNAAVSCINTIIYEHPLFEDRLRLIVELFGKNSIDYLRATIKENERVLKKKQLFDYYQQIAEEKSAPIQSPTVPTSPTTPMPHKQPQEIMEQLPETKPLKKAIKDNEIQFTKATYEGLTYNYQAYLLWDSQKLTCNIYDPFINVEVTAFDENGNITFNNPDMPLPLPVLLDNHGQIKSEISLPLSPRPFIVNYKNTELLQNALPTMTLNFYKNIVKINENDIEYLEKADVIKQQGSVYIHGTKSCKPLLERYFRLWNISEDQYKQIKEGWFTTLFKITERFVGTIKRFFNAIYYPLLALKTALFGEPDID